MNAPVGMNFFVAGYAYARGNVAFDPSLPLTDAELDTHTALFAYARTLGLWGRSAKFDILLSYTWLGGSASFEGALRRRDVSGLGDPRGRFVYHLLGAPELSMKEFAYYQQDIVVGVAVQVTVPAGQYDASKLINIGTHRWSFKSELGLTKSWGSWIFELAPSVTLFTTNDDFLGGGTLSQSVLYALQAHVVHSFPYDIWAALDATYYGGGSTTANGVSADTRQSNTRLGITLALPVDRNHSVKLNGSIGTTSRIGTDLNIVGAAWQYRLGGGL